MDRYQYINLMPILSNKGQKKSKNDRDIPRKHDQTFQMLKMPSIQRQP